MQYAEYTGEQLRLTALVRSRELSTYIFIETVSRSVTHLLMYKRERRSRNSILSSSVMDNPTKVFEIDYLLHEADREIRVDGPVMEYNLVPAILNNGVYEADMRSVCRLEAGERTEITYSVNRSRENKLCDRVSVNLMSANGAPIPNESLHYTIGNMPTIKYPFDWDVMTNNRLVIYVPSDCRVTVAENENGSLLVREARRNV
jgi:hypothetical protein